MFTLCPKLGILENRWLRYKILKYCRAEYLSKQRHQKEGNYKKFCKFQYILPMTAMSSAAVKLILLLLLTQYVKNPLQLIKCP